MLPHLAPSSEASPYVQALGTELPKYRSQGSRGRLGAALAGGSNNRDVQQQTRRQAHSTIRADGHLICALGASELPRRNWGSCSCEREPVLLQIKTSWRHSPQRCGSNVGNERCARWVDGQSSEIIGLCGTRTRAVRRYEQGCGHLSDRPGRARVLVTVPTRGGRSFKGRFAGKLWHHDHRTEKTGPQMTAKVRRVL